MANSAPIPVTGNGDILTRYEAARCAGNLPFHALTLLMVCMHRMPCEVQTPSHCFKQHTSALRSGSHSANRGAGICRRVAAQLSWSAGGP